MPENTDDDGKDQAKAAVFTTVFVIVWVGSVVVTINSLLLGGSV